MTYDYSHSAYPIMILRTQSPVSFLRLVLHKSYTSLRYYLMHYYRRLLRNMEDDQARDYAHSRFENTPAISSHLSAVFTMSICIDCLMSHICCSQGFPFESKVVLRFSSALTSPAFFPCCRQSACLYFILHSYIINYFASHVSSFG